jgi:hypothetical protein
MRAKHSGENKTKNEMLQVYHLSSVSVLEALQEVCSVARHRHAVVNAGQRLLPVGVVADSLGLFTRGQTRISTFIC